MDSNRIGEDSATTEIGEDNIGLDTRRYREENETDSHNIQQRLATSTPPSGLTKNYGKGTEHLNSFTIKTPKEPDISLQMDNIPPHGSESKFNKVIGKFQKILSNFWTKHAETIWVIVYGLLLLAYCGYFAYAIYYSLEGAIFLIVVTSLALVALVFSRIKSRFGSSIYRNVCSPVATCTGRNWKYLRWCV